MVKGSHCSDEQKQRISEALKGRVFTEEHRANLSKAKEGRSRPEDVRRRISEAQKGRELTKEHRNRISEANKGKRHPKAVRVKMANAKRGHKNPCWQGGISFEPYTPEFNDNLKDLVRERDGYTCQLCGRTQRENGRRLSVHHIDYNKRNCDMENLIALCLFCNGSVNVNREYWAGYFKEATDGSDSLY